MRVTRHEKGVYLKLTHKRQQEAGAESVYDCLVGFLFISLVCLDNSKMQHITFYFFACLTINLHTVKQNAAVMRKPRSRLHKRYTMFRKCLLLTCIVSKKTNQFKQKIFNLQVNAS